MSANAMTEFSLRRALSAKLKKLQQENFQLKLQVFMQESSGSLSPNSQSDRESFSREKSKLQKEFLKMKAEKREAEQRLENMEEELEELHEQSFTTTSSLLNATISSVVSTDSLINAVPELQKCEALEDKSRKMLAPMAAALYKMGSYHLMLNKECDLMEEEIATLREKAATVKTKFRATERQVIVTQQEVQMKQRNLRKKMIKRSQHVQRAKRGDHGTN